MYADLTGNREKYRIKSLYGNKIVAEGRFVYDCFVLNNKADAVYYHGTGLQCFHLPAFRSRQRMA